MKYVLVANPYEGDDFHVSEKESTLLIDFQTQLLNYEGLPKVFQSSKWKKRYNSNVFGFTLREIIRLYSSFNEPQLMIDCDENDFSFGGFLRHGLNLKNGYNKDAILNFPSVYHNNFFSRIMMFRLDILR